MSRKKTLKRKSKTLKRKSKTLKRKSKTLKRKNNSFKNSYSSVAKQIDKVIDSHFKSTTKTKGKINKNAKAKISEYKKF